ncbi:uncharacterized protein LOC141587415 [Silene latifolia]|uniref:uncharacterized protein LOC141587415 n=1 Tax=Silene latifolia TaxID=37657 RepID=UPI003D7845C8
MKTILSSPTVPSLFFLSDHFHTNSSSQFSQLSFTSCHLASFTRLSSTSVVQAQDSGLPSSPTDPANSDSLPFNGCKGCGKEQIESGCNGEGRIQGGIATFPGFGWWPIKAYRPCPGFVASGGSYRRRGQSLDEVAFGRGKGGASIYDSDDSETRKKGKNRKQFKS